MKHFVLIVFLLFVSALALAQSLDKGYYVVVGAFASSKESYAQKFVENLKKEGLDAHYAKDVKRNLFLVYLKEFGEFKPSIDDMLSTRKNTRFDDAWVRVIKNEGTSGRGEEGTSDVVTLGSSDVVTKEELKEKPGVNVNPVQQETTKPEKQAQESPTMEVIPKDTATAVTTSPPPNVTTSPKEIKLTFHMFDANNSSPVEGKVEIIDTERARLMQKNKATDTLSIPDPKSKTGMLSFITDVFGYRKIQHEISYSQPVVDSAKHYIDKDGDVYVLQFEMVRYHKGDIATLYNVFFFNDAAIMMPESRYELNKLLDMMQSNKNYRIRLHGHTNGNARGKIISMGLSKDFFNVKAADVKTGSGSAKALSGQRAEVIKDWLVAQGISADRVEVKSWGGRRMIHDKNSANARRNVRVEVEVLSE